MKKRMISCLLALCLVLSLMPAAAAAEVASGTCGKDLIYTTDGEGNMIVRENLNWSLDDAGTLTITGTGAMEDYTNTAMPGWEEYKGSIKAVRIQNGVTRIGSWAFENCTNLTSVTIPDSVTSIGYLAFSLCRSLPSIKIPNTVSSIEYRAFDGCSALASVNIPTSMTKLENSVFASCESLTSMVIPENITSIGEYVFSFCSNLKSIVIPDSVTSLGRGAFSSCSSLESIIIPEGVTSIGDWTFSSCTSLTELVIPSKVTSIDMYAVSGCTSLRSVTIPAGITKIPDVFGNCDNITDVYYSGTMTQWKEIPLGVSDAPLLAATIHCTDGDIVPENSDIIASGECGAQGDNVLWTLNNAGTLTITGTGDMADYSGLTYAPWYSNRSVIKQVSIGNGVTSIGYSAFASCEGLSDITIPSSVASIGEFAFSGCKNLSGITIPSGVTSIKPATFNGCSSLTNVTVPSSVTSIGVSAFGYCEELSGITIPSSVTSIWESTFEHCDKLSDVYYSGTKAQWNAVNIGELNDPLLAATIHCSDGDIIPVGADTGTYEITSPLGVLDEQNHHYTISGEQPWSFTVAAPEGDFAALYIDGTEIGGNSLPDGSMKYVGVAVDPQDDGMVTFTMLRLNMIGSGTHTIAVEFRKADQPGWVRRASQNFDVRLEDTAALPRGVRYVPYSESIRGEVSAQADADNIRYELKGIAPNGLSLSPDGTLSGVPMAAGTWKFSVLCLPASSDAENDSWTASEKPFELTILSNTDAAVKGPNDYTIIEPIGRPSGSDPNHFYKTEYNEERFVIDGPYSDFYRLRIDGVELEEPEDYTSEEGSTVITIRSQTFRRFGEGTHTISAEYRENRDPKSPLKQVAQNYTLTIDRPSSGGSSGSGSSSGGGSSDDDRRPSTAPNSTKPKPKPQKPEAKPTLPFTDVSPSDWFYEDLKWAYDNGIMLGVSDTEFAPQRRVSQATIVTVLARLAQVDLTRFDGEEESGITAGRSYTAAAVWAKRAGLLPEEGVFTGDETTTRNQMAVMLVKYLRSMGKDTMPPAQPAVFADAGDMTQEGNDAFQVLYQQSIFKGVGELNMNAAGSTTRAHFVALIHRIYEAAMTEA